MSKWHVELFCREPKVLDFLTTTVQESICSVVAGDTDCYYINPGSEPRLAARKTSGYYLLSSDFSSSTRAIGVWSIAKEILPLLNATIMLKFSSTIIPIELGNVYRPDKQGRMIWETAVVTTAMYSYPDENFLQAVNNQSPSLVKILLLAKKNNLVEEALYYYSLPHSWFTLRKIFEIISTDVRKTDQKTWNTWARGWANNFLQTASSYHWSGRESVHSSVSSEKKPAVTLMSIEDAIKRITDLFIKWLHINP